MLYFEIAVSMITFLAMVISLILLATGRTKPKPIILRKCAMDILSD